LRSLKKQLCRLLVEMASRQFKPTEKGRAAHRAHHDAVFDLYVADPPRGKQSLVFLIYRTQNIFSLLYFVLRFLAPQEQNAPPVEITTSVYILTHILKKVKAVTSATATNTAFLFFNIVEILSVKEFL